MELINRGENNQGGVVITAVEGKQTRTGSKNSKRSTVIKVREEVTTKTNKSRHSPTGQNAKKLTKDEKHHRIYDRPRWISQSTV